jgi:type IV secretory pathway VirB2 component (pilin)
VNYRMGKQSYRRLIQGASRLALVIAIFGLLLPAKARAASPWEDAVNALQVAFTGPIARGLSLVSIVVGGLMFAFAEGDSKRMLAGIVFGVGMAIGAVNFMAWLFP